MMERDFFNEQIRGRIWEIHELPFLFAVVNFDKNGLKSQEVAEITDGGYKFICM